MIGRAAIVVVLLWSSAANAHFQRWQYPHYGCGQWSRCYVHALSHQRMSGMVTRYSPSRWTTRR